MKKVKEGKGKVKGKVKKGKGKFQVKKGKVKKVKKGKKGKVKKGKGGLEAEVMEGSKGGLVLTSDMVGCGAHQRHGGVRCSPATWCKACEHRRCALHNCRCQ